MRFYSFCVGDLMTCMGDRETRSVCERLELWDNLEKLTWMR